MYVIYKVPHLTTKILVEIEAKVLTKTELRCEKNTEHKTSL